MSDEPAIIQGTYADLKFIRTRSVVQIVVEAPITDAPRIVRLLGAPDPATETWLAVAVLSDKPAKQPEVKRDKRPWNTLTPTEQACIRSNDSVFEQFIAERVYPALTPTTVANSIRIFCGVDSRAELNTNPEAKEKWQELDQQFQAWMDEPRYTG